MTYDSEKKKIAGARCIYFFGGLYIYTEFFLLLYYFSYCFVYVNLFLSVLSVLPPSDNSIAVNNNNNNNTIGYPP
jgi:hypothetical protein